MTTVGPRAGRGSMRAYARCVGYARVVALALLVGGSALTTACGNQDARRREVRGNDARRSQRIDERKTDTVPQPVTDTASLVTAIRGDSLIGAARGAGGVVTLRNECAACHPSSHEQPFGRGVAISLSCAECHETDHAPVQAFYAGKVPGIDVHADTMFLARVSCVGCHNDTTFAAAAGAPRHAALDRMCTSCHGERFKDMLHSWRQGVTWRTDAVLAYVNAASNDPRLGGAASSSRVRVARQAIDFVRTVGALHNVRGADRLFHAALDNAAAAYARAGVAAPGRPALGPDVTRGTCMGCHYGVEAAKTTIFGETFDHRSHVVRSDVACTECHSNAGYFIDGKSGGPDEDKDVDPRHGKTPLTAASCDNCHHAPTQPLECNACHANDAKVTRPIRVTMAMDLRQEKAPKSRDVTFLHSEHARTACADCHRDRAQVRTAVTCSTCHTDHHRPQTLRCASCHGTETQMRQAHSRNDHVTCATCHQRETVARLMPNRAFCLSCHVAQADHKPGRECAPCHMQVSPTELRRRMVAAGAAR